VLTFLCQALEYWALKIYDSNMQMDFSTEKPILINGKFINDFNDVILGRYNAGYKTVIISDTLDRNDIRAFLGLKTFEMPQEIKDDSEKVSFDITKTFQIATVIQKYKGFDIIAGINVGEESYIEVAIKRAIRYDYTKLFSENNYTTEDYNWQIYGSDADSTTANMVTVDASLQVWRDGPDGQGRYYFHTKLINEASGVNGQNKVGWCNTTTNGPLASTILEYGPPNQTVPIGSDVSFSLSYGIGTITYTLVPKVQITKHYQT